LADGLVAVAEVADGDDEDLVAGGDDVGDGSLHPTGARRAVDGDVAAGVRLPADAVDDLGEQSAEAGAAVVDERFGLGDEHRRRYRRRPRRHEDLWTVRHAVSFRFPSRSGPSGRHAQGSARRVHLSPSVIEARFPGRASPPEATYQPIYRSHRKKRAAGLLTAAAPQCAS